MLKHSTLKRRESELNYLSNTSTGLQENCGGRIPKVELSFEKEGGYVYNAFDFIMEHGDALERDRSYNKPLINLS